jgi:hypothetical protein
MDQHKKTAERAKHRGVNRLECRSNAEKTAHDQACLGCWMVGGLLLSDISLFARQGIAATWDVETEARSRRGELNQSDNLVTATSFFQVVGSEIGGQLLNMLFRYRVYIESGICAKAQPTPCRCT